MDSALEIQNKPTRKDKIVSILPAFIAASFDIFLTIFYQSQEYWNGDLSKGNEGNPIGASFMKGHVSGIFFICGIWLIMIVLAGFYLPKKLKDIFVVFCIIAHSWGASTWIDDQFGYWSVIVLFLINASIYSLVKQSSKA